MATSKRPRKKYNPKQKAIQRVAPALWLLHRNSMGTAPNGEPIMTGEIGRLLMSEHALFELIKAVTNTPRRWIFEGFAVFDDGETQYTQSEPGCTLQSVDFPAVHDIVSAQIERCKKSGNPNHLQDWGWRVCVYTPARYAEVVGIDEEVA